jgi:hypothetical protein
MPTNEGPTTHTSDETFMKEAPPGMEAETSPDLLRLLHELRAEVQNLQEILATVRAGKAALKIFAGVIQKTLDDVRPILGELSDPAYPDLIRRILNAWERVNACPLITDPEASYEAQQQMGYVEMLDEQLNKIVFLIGQRTVPVRVNDWLKRSRPGYYLPFNQVFDSELPSPEDRQKVLNFLAWAPDAVKNGIVDPNQGLIYRYASSRRARNISLAWVIVIFVLLTALLVAACFAGNLLPAGGWPLTPANLGMMAAGWVAVLVGVVVHLAVGSVKRSRQNGGLPAVLAIDDLPLVIDARKGQIILKMSLAFLGLFFLAIASGVDKMSILSAFLVGYSLDSFIELFGSSLEQQSQALAGSIKQQLGV